MGVPVGRRVVASVDVRESRAGHCRRPRGSEPGQGGPPTGGGRWSPWTSGPVAICDGPELVPTPRWDLVAQRRRADEVEVLDNILCLSEDSPTRSQLLVVGPG